MVIHIINWKFQIRALNQIQNTRILRSMRLTFLTFGKHKIFKMICVILNFKCGKADCIKEDKHDDIFFFPPLTPYSSRCSVPGEVLESFQAFISAYHYVMAQFALHDMLRFSRKKYKKKKKKLGLSFVEKPARYTIYVGTHKNV